MNLKNSLTLTIRARDFNLVATQPASLKQLRKLTLAPYSGMNQEMDRLIKIMDRRPVSAKVLTAYKQDEMVAWALMSREHSDFLFHNTFDHFHPSDGVLVEMYVHPDHRRQGIGTKLLKVARRKAFPTRLCVSPWDEKSRQFYENFKHYGAKWL